MRYTGHVEPHGQTQTRDLGEVTVTKMSVGPLDNNCYVLTWIRTGDTVLIDAAAQPSRILQVVQADPTSRTVRAIVTTHSHDDHWQALAEVAAATGAPVLAGAADAAELPVPVHTELVHGDRIDFGDSHLEVIGLRGHTPGSVAILYREPTGQAHLFTGDSLFPGGPGKTSNPADFTSLMDDLTVRVFGVLDDDTWVYPGHGDDTTLGAERPQLATWRARGW